MKLRSYLKTVTAGIAFTLVLTPADGATNAWRLPDTGQTLYRSDATGEDGNYQMNMPSYTKLDADGRPLPASAETWTMVKDDHTGLTWEIKTKAKGPHYYGLRRTWEQARTDHIDALNKEKFGGATDWRLPTVQELVAITHKGKSLPTIDQRFFPYTETWDFWSATPDAEDHQKAWRVHFCRGMVANMPKTSKYLVRAVRGPASPKANLLKNGDGTITDPATGLTWTRAYAPLMTWRQAVEHCETLEMGGHDDWRLPNAHELQTIVDYTRHNPAADRERFVLPALDDHPEKRPTAPKDQPQLRLIYEHVPDHRLCFWSSSYYASNHQRAWVVDFKHGIMMMRDKGTRNYVRAVRGGAPKFAPQTTTKQPN